MIDYCYKKEFFDLIKLIKKEFQISKEKLFILKIKSFLKRNNIIEIQNLFNNYKKLIELKNIIKLINIFNLSNDLIIEFINNSKLENFQKEKLILNLNNILKNQINFNLFH